MLEKLIVGRYLELNVLPPVNAGPAANGFQEVNSVVQHVAESESSATPTNFALPAGSNPSLGMKAQIAAAQLKAQMTRQRVSTTGVGAVAKVHRNYVWLEWLGGLVSEVRSNGVDVLTGPMSGCWIMSYLRGGVRFVGHVGTVNTAADPLSVAARAAWNNFAAGLALGSRSGFRPFNDWVGPRPAPQPGEGAMKHFAIVTNADTFHTMIGFSQMARPSRLRIAAVQQIPDSLPANGMI